MRILQRLALKSKCAVSERELVLEGKKIYLAHLHIKEGSRLLKVSYFPRDNFCLWFSRCVSIQYSLL